MPGPGGGKQSFGGGGEKQGAKKPGFGGKDGAGQGSKKPGFGGKSGGKSGGAKKKGFG